MITAILILLGREIRRRFARGLPWGAYPERPMPVRDAEWYRRVWEGAGAG